MTKKVGRPTKFDEAKCEQARKLCLLGATNPDLAKFFEVSDSTISKWIAEFPEFSGAVKAGRAEADANVGSRLYERATGYSHPDTHVSNYQGAITLTALTKHYPPDATSAIFWLKNRRPDLWRDRIEHTGKDGKDLIPPPPLLEVARHLAYVLTSAAKAA